MRAEVDLPQGIEIHKNATDTTSDKKYQFRTLFVASLTLVAVVIYAAIAAWQLCQMRKANDLAFNTAIRQLRAYVGVHQIGMMGTEDNSPFGIGFQFINHGQTPASKFNFKGAVDLLPYPLPDDYVLPNPPDRPIQDGVIFPNETNTMTGWVLEDATLPSA